MGMNNMGGMMGGGQNLEQTIQMLENPMIQQMMNQMMSNPAMMQSMMESNPMLRQMRESNPEIAAMMSNPEMIRSMMNPDNLRAMAQMQNAFGSMGIRGAGFPPMMSPFGGAGVNNSGGGNNPPNSGGLDFSSLLGQTQSTSVSPMGSFSGNTNTSDNTIPPEQRYRMQLQSLNDMGFDDNRVNIAALMQTHGNVNRAIDVLLTNPPAPIPDETSSSSGASSTPSTTNATTS